jgi:hypothetical protein
LQIVETRREGRRPGQRVLATLGRVEQRTATGTVDGLLRSRGRFAEPVRVIEAQRHGHLEAGTARQLGPARVFGWRWQSVGLQALLTARLRERHVEFPMERAVYLTALHRLVESGSDRAAARWRRAVRLPGPAGLAWHQLYRARRWLGETQAAVEEALFRARRDLGTDRTLAFFATTSLDGEGQGGESLGQ